MGVSKGSDLRVEKSWSKFFVTVLFKILKNLFLVYACMYVQVSREGWKRVLERDLQMFVSCCVDTGN